MSTAIFEVVKVQNENIQTPKDAVKVLKRYDRHLSRGVMLRHSGVTTAIKFLEDYFKKP